MPFDPYLALNAMLRAEAARFSPPAPPAPPVRQTEPEPAPAAEVPAADGKAE
ncbi:hypothetical protein J7F03_03895 [Streptomyces sp. ISL-43]|uniref:hypothetical protein n=1 Tax=Streptomyces sp. ISL-43 TaxID=2819183 RepID=UPI001BE5EE68|nr:hypothetical protein [Streptomyces sp. ISL-43]MBT2446239.1 hypothetical protein [Streptomyces sp. ISL-43]